MRSYKEEYQYWLDSPALDEEEWKELSAIADDEKEIESRFYAPLEFGTAGLRGVMATGLNRMNVHIIRWATQAFAEVVKAEGPEACERGVVVCYDCRLNSARFAHEAAGVMAANGVRVRIFDALRPTPELSFAVIHYGAQAGINITAATTRASITVIRSTGPTGPSSRPSTPPPWRTRCPSSTCSRTCSAWTLTRPSARA